MPKNSPILNAYMDDSGTHDGSHNCVVAGYWGGVNEWRRFERSWSEVLRSEGISEFKANEFWLRPGGRRIGPYKDWTDERHRRFIHRLLGIIEERRIVPFATGVLGSEWQSLTPRFRRLFSDAMASPHGKPDVGKSIFLPFQICVVRLLEYCHPGVKMNFVIDHDRRISTRVLRSYSDLKRSAQEDGEREWLSHLGEVTFGDSHSILPLQAADLLAYEAHRYAKAAAKAGNANYPIRHEYRRALRHARTREDFWLFDAPRMSRLTRQLDAMVAANRAKND